MCLAIPGKIIKVDGDWAVIEAEGHTNKVNISLVQGAEVGEYVLAHGDMAINKLLKEEAERIKEMVGSLECSCHGHEHGHHHHDHHHDHEHHHHEHNHEHEH